MTSDPPVQPATLATDVTEDDDDAGGSAEPPSAGASASGFDLDVADDADALAASDEAWLADRLRDAAARLGVTRGRLSLALLDDASMAEAHGRFLDDPTPTDVITFDLRDAPSAGPVDGELLLGADVARRQAVARGHATRVELLLYALHGLLHLLGEDDRDDAGYRRMHAREDEVLGALGLGRVFAASAVDGPPRDADSKT